MRSTTIGASGRTSLRRGMGVFLTALAGLRLQMSALEGALQNPAEQRRRVANGDSAASGREAIALPPGDHLRRDLDEGERAELREDVLVV